MHKNNVNSRLRLHFLGAAGTVTGSKYVVETPQHAVMIDCGLFQGLKFLRLRNWAPLPSKPNLDAVVLTHAHLDHSGYLPVLVKNGFKGRIYCTVPTRDLCEILLRDSARLQEEEADFANRHGFSKHKPALPLYTVEDAERAIEQFEVIDFDAPFSPAPGVVATFIPAGHMLGAASVRIEAEHRSILFSGDLGRDDDLILNPPHHGGGADYLVVESTYGNRLRNKGDVLKAMVEVINRTIARGGNVIIPSFAVGRAQTLLYLIYQAKASKQIPDVPVFLDSPMATNATRIFHRHRKQHRLTPEQCEGMCHAAKIVNTPQESQALTERRGPAIIIAGSGMATGGRVVHHIKAMGGDRRNTILFAGFQAAGTRGAAIVEGAESVKIHGQYVAIRAEIVNLGMLSGHADRDELLKWISDLDVRPQRVFVTHGEPTASDALRLTIEERLGWNCIVPQHQESYNL